MKFDKKIVKCDSSVLHETSSKMEEEWIVSLLRRFKVDPAMIKKAQEDENYGKSSWRSFLFENYGIRIEKDLVTKKVQIRRLNFTDYKDVVLGAWSAPEIVRVDTGKEKYCELHLKYWQIV